LKIVLASVVQRRIRLLAALSVLLLIFLALPAFLAAPVSSALFRLHASTQLLHLRSEAPNTFTIRTSGWELTSAKDDGDATGITQTLTSRSQAASGESSADLITIFLEPADQIELRQRAAGGTRYTLTLPSRSTKVSVQLGEHSQLVRKDSQDGETVEPEFGSATLFNAIGDQGALIRFTSETMEEDIAQRLSVSRLGFGLVREDEIFAGLLDGNLQFLDKPDNELKLYRGTDLQLGELDAEISAIVLSEKGIHLDVQGRTDDAYLRVALRDESSRLRNVLPTRLEWLKGDPVTAVLVGFIAALCGAAGLLFALAQAIPTVGTWLQGLRAYL